MSFVYKQKEEGGGVGEEREVEERELGVSPDLKRAAFKLPGIKNLNSLSIAYLPGNGRMKMHV